MRRTLFLLLVGLGGAAILVSLGLWQVQRLAWKEALIAQIDSRIAADPQPLPDAPDPDADAYLPVAAQGTLLPQRVDVLVSQRDAGAGYRVIMPLAVGEGRRIMVDLGFVPVEARDAVRPGGAITVSGNLQWPQETDSFTPEPDLERNIWFARDVPAMAAALEAEPVLLVASRVDPAPEGIAPLPVDTARIPNDHLQYAITWFSLAAIWLAMSVMFLLRRRAAQPEG